MHGCCRQSDCGNGWRIARISGSLVLRCSNCGNRRNFPGGSLLEALLDKISGFIAGRLKRQTSGYEPFTPSDPVTLLRTLQPGDVLLVEGNQKVSAAIKFLTQSTWSHAAIYAGDIGLVEEKTGELQMLIEANLGEGVVVSPLSKYATYNTRICRPVGLNDEDRKAIVDFCIKRIGNKYDTRNIIDLARYLLPIPPVPIRWRRRMIALGSGDPTREICSTLIAQAFQKVKYPILPLLMEGGDDPRVRSYYSQSEMLHIRHHSLFTPRDFDVSPFFNIVKPTIEHGFDYKLLRWGSEGGHGEHAASKTVDKNAES